MTEICDFPYPIYDLAKIRYPIYDRCGWHSYLKLKLWRAFIDLLIDNDEKVVSSKKHTQFKTRVQKPYPIYDQNDWKTLPFGAAYTYIAHIRGTPLPPGPRFKTQHM